MRGRLLQAQVRRYHGQTSPEALFALGPRIRVTISLPDAVKSLRGSNQEIEVEALIDTGATHTCISTRVAQSLSLNPTGRATSLGVHGVGYSNRYFIDFTFTGSNLTCKDWEVMDFNSAGSNLDMLIGRDILINGLLVYDGATGQIGMELPSVTHPMNSPPWLLKDPVHGLDRKERRRQERNARKRNRRKK